MASDGKNKLPEELTDTIGQIYRKHYDNIDNEIIPTIKFPVAHIVDHLLFGAEIEMRKN
jgi:hypothetical protein